MSRHIMILLTICACSSVNAQITWDTARHEGGYGIFKPSVGASFFYAGHGGVEISRVRNRLSLVWLMSNTTCTHYGIQWINNPNYPVGLWGAKAGGELDTRLLHFGIGALALTDFERIRFYLAPEGGLSWWGTATIYYRYLGLVGNKEFTGNDTYQVGLKYNFTKDLAREFRNGVD
jgi:hypothetical protein